MGIHNYESRTLPEGGVAGGVSAGRTGDIAEAPLERLLKINNLIFFLGGGGANEINFK